MVESFAIKLLQELGILVVEEIVIDIVITADYEIFGNGTGDVRYCLVNPTHHLLRICNEYGAKLTLFFEIVEYYAFKKAETEGKLHLGYSPSDLMRGQALEAVKSGHDVQLHLHPQWLDAVYTDEGWRVNLNYWRLPNVPHGIGNFNDILSLRGLLFHGKHELEKFLKPVCSDYECICVRAGGYCIQPSHEVIQVMREVGLIADSSVFKGGYIQEPPFNVDFRNAFSESYPWWADPMDINKPVNTKIDTILEMPIFTIRRRRISILTLRKITGLFLRARSMQHPSGCSGGPVLPVKRRPIPQKPTQIFRYLLEYIPIQWDFCALTGQEMWEFLAEFINKNVNTISYCPLIMIGHPKTFAKANHAHLRMFLDKVVSSHWFKDGTVSFSTMRHAVRKTMAALSNQ
jgi:hypothetical protein